MIGVVFSFLLSILFKNILFKNKEAPFVMELPVYRNPGIRLIVRHMWTKGAHYLKKMGGVILLASLIIWALGYFPREVDYTQNYEELIAAELEKGQDASEANMANFQMQMASEHQLNSFIGRIGVAIEPVIRPLGFDWKMGISLVTGFAAKEIVVSTMGVLYQVDAGEGSYGTVSLQERIAEQEYTSGPKAGTKVFTPLAGISFLLFVLFYLPCVAVIAAVGREAGSWKWAGFVLFYTTAIAWTVSFVVYQLGSLIQLG
jgi:ferrous iron transport protein B